MRQLLLLFLVVIAQPVLAQRGHHLGSLVFDFNTGIDVYRSTNVYTRYQGDHYVDTIVSADAGNANGSVGVEIGVGRFVGVGVRAKTSVFFRTLDAVMNARADVYANDLLVAVNLHPLPLNRFDLVMGAEFGISKLKFNVNDVYKTQITGSGGLVSIHVTPRFYFKRFGFHLRAALPVFSYNELVQNRDSGRYLLSKWKANGFGMNVGLQYRLF